MRLLQQFGLNLARGFAMGAADIVPGVSGGTIALLLGIYRRLVMQIQIGSGAVARLATGRLARARSDVRHLEPTFLLGLLTGIAAAVFTLAGLLDQLVDDYPVQVSAAFFGLVLGSVVVVRHRVSNWRARWCTAPPLVAFVLSAGAAFFALGLRGEGVGEPAGVVFFVAGAVAICAMILPGISGALLLLLVGLYDNVTNAVRERDLATLALVAAGAVVGLALFSHLLGRLLERHHDVTLGALMGLMAGSLRVLWPWPATVVTTDGSALSGIDNTGLGAPVASQVPMAAVLCIGAFMVVVVLARRSGEGSLRQNNLNRAPSPLLACGTPTRPD